VNDERPTEEPCIYEAGGCRHCGERLYAEVYLRALASGETSSWEVYHAHPRRCVVWSSGNRADCIPVPATYCNEPELKAAIEANTKLINERFGVTKRPNFIYAFQEPN
jgi:hypothetical protein